MVHLLRVEEEYRLELREIRFDSSMLRHQGKVPRKAKPGNEGTSDRVAQLVR